MKYYVITDEFQTTKYEFSTKREVAIFLKKLKENDILKNKYCEQRGVNLLRIPYYDIRKIPSILDTKLKTLEAA
jgi:tRNA splicing ligase